MGRVNRSPKQNSDLLVTIIKRYIKNKEIAERKSPGVAYIAKK